MLIKVMIIQILCKPLIIEIAVSDVNIIQIFQPFALITLDLEPI